MNTIYILLIIALICISIILCVYSKYLLKEYTKENTKHMMLKLRYRGLEKDTYKLKSELEYTIRQQRIEIERLRHISINSNNIPYLDEIIKFARIYSHPDKGICKDNSNFIKFNEAYQYTKQGGK